MVGDNSDDKPMRRGSAGLDVGGGTRVVMSGEEMRLDYTHKVIEALQGDEKPLKFKISEDFNV